MVDEPPSAAELRARAERARALANGLLPNDETARRLRQVADELEAEADALERQQPRLAFGQQAAHSLGHIGYADGLGHERAQAGRMPGKFRARHE